MTSKSLDQEIYECYNEFFQCDDFDCCYYKYCRDGAHILPYSEYLIARLGE